jgi:hypothetical protein
MPPPSADADGPISVSPRTLGLRPSSRCLLLRVQSALFLAFRRSFDSCLIVPRCRQALLSLADFLRFGWRSYHNCFSSLNEAPSHASGGLRRAIGASATPAATILAALSPARLDHTPLTALPLLARTPVLPPSLACRCIPNTT